jgi:hypothetical protein
MEGGDYVTEHLNAFNTLVDQLVFVDINHVEEDTCITLLCYFPDSWDNLFVEIGSTTTSALMYEDVVSSLLLEKMRRKSMDSYRTNALFLIGCPQDRNENKTRGAR